MAVAPFDVIVVGSGPGGGIATWRLAEAGLRVALVESGGRLRAGIDYGAHVNPYATLEPRLKAGFTSPIPNVSADHWERDHFTPVGDRPGHGVLRALGGRSLCWAGHSLRFGPGDYRHWPIAYEEVAPYYSKAERIMGVHGFKDGLWNMPDGEFQKGVPYRCGEQMLKRGADILKTRGRKMELVAQRKAIPTEKHARATCHYCGHCMAGCEIDCKYTSANTPIPMAMKTGNLTVFTESTMTRILSKDGRVTGIVYLDSKGQQQELSAKSLVLSCNSIETPRHLLINNLANSSGHVGRNLTSHFGITVTGIFPELHGRDGSNDDGTDYYHSLLSGLYWDQPNPKFEGTYQVQCGSGLHPSRLPVRGIPGYGAQLKRDLREWNNIHASMNMQGSLLVSSKKLVDLDPSRKDKYGLPLPRIHLHYEDSDVAMANDCVATCEEIIRAAGGRVILTPGTVDPSKLQIDYNHWVGTVRMGKDPKSSVVNTAGQSHDIPNLFIADASVFAAYPEKNPTLTNIALSWRTADGLAAKFRNREI
ncbi:MAG: GMC family oxidoreductase [Bryobacteraceae bacterium]